MAQWHVTYWQLHLKLATLVVSAETRAGAYSAANGKVDPEVYCDCTKITVNRQL